MKPARDHFSSLLLPHDDLLDLERRRPDLQALLDREGADPGAADSPPGGFTPPGGSAVKALADLVPLLQAVQTEFGFLPRNVLALLAEKTGIPLARVYGVATFYASFFLAPRGRCVVRVCQGTACHVRGAPRITDALVTRLGVRPGETTPDMAFTLETVACLGCCSLAPVITVGADTFGRLDQKKAVAVLAGQRSDEPAGT